MPHLQTRSTRARQRDRRKSRLAVPQVTSRRGIKTSWWLAVSCSQQRQVAAVSKVGLAYCSSCEAPFFFFLIVRAPDKVASYQDKSAVHRSSEKSGKGWRERHQPRLLLVQRAYGSSPRGRQVQRAERAETTVRPPTGYILQFSRVVRDFSELHNALSGYTKGDLRATERRTVVFSRPLHPLHTARLAAVGQIET